MTSWTLVTGASEGLGKAFARIAAKEGRNVIVTARSKDKLDNLADELALQEGQVVVIPADLSDGAEVDRLWAEATDGRTIDILVNNAGLGRNGDFGDGTGWDREAASIAVNVDAVTRLMKLAIPHMAEAGGGRVLNVASTAAFLPGPNMAVYHATKAFVLSLTEAVAAELGANSKVKVTALCPGATETNFFNDADMTNMNLIKWTKLPSAHDVALLGWRGAKAGQRIVVPGLMNKVFAFLPRIAPRRVVTAATKLFLTKGH